jgi:hypothetical protein
MVLDRSLSALPCEFKELRLAEGGTEQCDSADRLALSVV